jgi:hypothetical protein
MSSLSFAGIGSSSAPQIQALTVKAFVPCCAQMPRKTKRFRLKNAVPGPDATQLAATPGQDLRKARTIAIIGVPVWGSSGEFRYKSIASRISINQKLHGFRI